MNEEILAKARTAKSPEELLKIAHDNGMTDFTEENAKAYFEAMHKSGELADEEMDVSAGGCGTLRAHGQIMVSIFNSCGHYRCGACNSSYSLGKKAAYRDEETLNACDQKVFDPNNEYGHTGRCGDCYYCSYERGAWWCNNKPHYNE